MERKWNVIWRLFGMFFKIGPLTFGGGYAMLPWIEKEVVEKHKWLQKQDLTQMLSISQSAPGAIALNFATFIGFRLGGFIGSLAASLGVLLSAFIVVVMLRLFFLYFHEYPIVMAAFKGIGASVVALIAYAGWQFARTTIFDKTTLLTFCVALFILMFSSVNPMILIVAGALFGMVWVKIKEYLKLDVRLEKDRSSLSNR